MDRPTTSKARGACRYYMTPRGCFAGDNCKFLHGQEQSLTPYDQSKSCRFYAQGTSETVLLLPFSLMWSSQGIAEEGTNVGFDMVPLDHLYGYRTTSLQNLAQWTMCAIFA